MKTYGLTATTALALGILLSANIEITDGSLRYTMVKAAKGGNSGGNSFGGKADKDNSNNAGNASDRAKEVANARSVVGRAASAEEKAGVLYDPF